MKVASAGLPKPNTQIRELRAGDRKTEDESEKYALTLAFAGCDDHHIREYKSVCTASEHSRHIQTHNLHNCSPWFPQIRAFEGTIQGIYRILVSPHIRAHGISYHAYVRARVGARVGVRMRASHQPAASAHQKHAVGSQNSWG